MKSITRRLGLGLLVISILMGIQNFAFAQELYEVVLFEENLMVPMRDGVKLGTDIYRPAKDGVLVEEKLPLIFQRTPYNKSSGSQPRQAKYLTSRGYVVAVQDCRGRYSSEGVFTKYMDEPKDGYDAVEWLGANLPYINGDVGMWGLSYGAHVQASASKLNPSHLKTIVVNMGGTLNGWDHAIRNNGAFALKQLTWAFGQVKSETDNPVVKEMLAIEKTQDWFTALPLKKGLNPLSIAPNFEDYIFEMMTHTDYDDYWKNMGVNWEEYHDQTSDIPMIHISGWYDAYCGTAIGNYLGLSKVKESPVRLMIGPWIHGRIAQSWAGDVDFGQDAVIEDFYDDWHVRWFDYFLKGKDTGVEQAPAIELFIMGTGDGSKNEEGRLNHGGFWRTEEDWPIPRTKFTNYYFHADGTLSTKLPGPLDPPITYTYDPENPVPTIGGSMAASKPVYVGGAFDQREREYTGDPEVGFFGSKAPYLPLKSRSDIVVFQTEPLLEDLEITGPIVVKLLASSTALDTDFTVKLIDVYAPSADFPSGFEMNLTDGILRARYRNSPERQELMKSGEIYEFVIRPFGTANVFKKGHRIRIDISSSNFPRFDVNPNTGEPLGMSRRMIKADNSIYCNLNYPSHVILPVIPAEE